MTPFTKGEAEVIWLYLFPRFLETILNAIIFPLLLTPTILISLESVVLFNTNSSAYIKSTRCLIVEDEVMQRILTLDARMRDQDSNANCDPVCAYMLTTQ